MNFKFSKQNINSVFRKTIGSKVVKHGVFPASAALVFCLTVFYWNNQNYGLALEYKGQTIATVSNEEVYEKANHMILDQLGSNNKSKIEGTSAQLKIAPVGKEECCQSPHEIKDKIIEKSQEVITNGFGLYVNGKLIVIGKSEAEIKSVLDDILNKQKNQDPNLDLKFAEKVEILQGIFSPEEIKDASDIKEALTSGVETFTQYTVVEGDTVTGVAKKFGTTTQELLSLNSINEDAIAIGDKLIIKTMDKVLHTASFKILDEEKEIPYSIERTPDASLERSAERVTQEGKTGKEAFKYRIVYSDGYEISREELEHTIIEEPIARKITVGTKQTVEKGGFAWPVPFTKKVTSPYGSRSGGFHKGVDIAASGISGKPIVAAQSGTVKCAQYSSKGYGNHIIIDHGNGQQTVYGHCQSLNVSAGQKVSKGDKIGCVGSTGDSTGPHLHFEVRISGQAKDPKKYV